MSAEYRTLRPRDRMRILFMLTTSLVLAACGAADASTRDAAGSGARAVDGAAASPQSFGSAESAAADPHATSIELVATIDGERYSASGSGECKHAPQASIYGVPSAMWLAQYFGQGAVRTVALTLWRPQSGGDDQLSLSLTTTEGTSRISTVQGGELVGSARAQLELDGAGGRLRVDGRDADGTPVTLDLHCSRFTALEAVGG